MLRLAFALATATGLVAGAVSTASATPAGSALPNASGLQPVTEQVGWGGRHCTWYRGHWHCDRGRHHSWYRDRPYRHWRHYRYHRDRY